MELLRKILECNEDSIDFIIKQAIEEADFNSNKVEKLGFLDYGKLNKVFEGFIPLNTRIRYSSLSVEDYGMQTTDFIYEFAYFIRKYNINTKASLIQKLEYFINSYFGIQGKEKREEIFNENAWNTTTTDEEYFEALANNKIGDLKHKGAAECTERGAMAQQILSLFGTECYYCIGCVELGNHQEGHCFNVVKRKNDYAVLDYSCPVISESKEGNIKAYYPFVGILSNEEFLDFTNNATIKRFENYKFVDGKRISIKGERLYIVGECEIKKEKNKTESRLKQEITREMDDSR